MARIIDLDLLAPPGVVVRKDGQEYKLPGDPPVELWLSIIAAHDEWQAAGRTESNEALGQFHDRMLDLFQVENPDLEVLPFGVDGMFAVLAGFFGTLDDTESKDPQGADEAASTTRTTRGRASSAAKKKKPPTRSRSSRSSAR